MYRHLSRQLLWYRNQHSATTPCLSSRPYHVYPEVWSHSDYTRDCEGSAEVLGAEDFCTARRETELSKSFEAELNSKISHSPEECVRLRETVDVGQITLLLQVSMPVVYLSISLGWVAYDEGEQSRSLNIDVEVCPGGEVRVEGDTPYLTVEILVEEIPRKCAL